MAGRTLPCRLRATVEAVVWHDDGLQGHAWMQSLGAGCKDHIVIYTGDQNE